MLHCAVIYTDTQAGSILNKVTGRGTEPRAAAESAGAELKKAGADAATAVKSAVHETKSELNKTPAVTN
jgi:hypothetical protein